MDSKDSNIKYTRAIKDISEDDRPREKALKHGISSLSKAELLAILIGSGTTGESVIDLSQRILQWCDGRLITLGRRTVGDLKRNFKGIGDAKGITILAALELARQYSQESSSSVDVPQITDSAKAYDVMRYNIAHLPHEEFWIVALNTAKKVIGRFRISQGGLDATVADPKIIMKTALDNYASCIILYHNHPSGNINPSQRDDMLTNKIAQASKILDIPVVDHIIVCEQGYYSYADNGKL